MRFILCFLLLCLMGCMKESIATTAIIRGESGAVFPVERLFTLDGCGVYRIKDGVATGYVSVCPQVICTAPTSCPTPTPKHHLEDETK